MKKFDSEVTLIPGVSLLVPFAVVSQQKEKLEHTEIPGQPIPGLVLETDKHVLHALCFAYLC